MSSSAIAEKPDAKTDEVKPEAVPKDTAAELERVKQLVGAHIGIDMRSPGQVAQADADAEHAQKELEVEQGAGAVRLRDRETGQAASTIRPVAVTGRCSRRSCRARRARRQPSAAAARCARRGA